MRGVAEIGVCSDRDGGDGVEDVPDEPGLEGEGGVAVVGGKGFIFWVFEKNDLAFCAVSIVYGVRRSIDCISVIVQVLL